jgi:hypothetical protein
LKSLLSKQNLVILFIYSIFFLTLFIQFPLKKSLPGNCDTWHAISLSNIYKNKVKNLVQGNTPASSMYPAKNIYSYGESSMGGSLIFIFFRTMGFNNINAYYLYISCLFSLTAFGIFILANSYINHPGASFLAGFIFTCSNLMFAHIDDSILMFYFFPALSMFFLKQYFFTEKIKNIYIAALLGGIQVYFSLYVFIYQTLALFSLLAANYKLVLKRTTQKVFIKASILYVLFALPFFLFYLNTLLYLEIASPWNNSVLHHIEVFSLQLTDIFKILPDNLLYSNIPQTEESVFWNYIRHHAFLGIIAPALAIMSLKKLTPGKLELVIIMFIGLFFSFGYSIRIGETLIHTPMYYIYHYLPLTRYIRVPIRAYFLVSLSISILASHGLHSIFVRYKLQNRKKFFILILILFIHFLENTPFPLMSFKAEKLAAIPSSYKNFFKNQEKKIILDLPTSLGTDFQYSNRVLFPYNREVIYMNWQTEHEHFILGGVNGYYPKSRVEVQKYVEKIPERNTLNYLNNLGVNYIVFHKNLLLPEERNPQISLDNSSELKKVHETIEIAIYQLNTKN